MAAVVFVYDEICKYVNISFRRVCRDGRGPAAVPFFGFQYFSLVLLIQLVQQVGQKLVPGPGSCGAGSDST